MKIKFKAFDYTKEGTFLDSEYEFSGDKQLGWEIARNNKPYLKLEKGYELLKTRLCGICSTDLSRRFLPFALPQVIGHEVVAESIADKKKYVVEINDTSYYRNDEKLDIFSENGLPTHTPGRMVLGIDRLLGGFSPYILVPQKSAIPIEGLSEYTAVLIEPFAAALQAVLSSPPKEGDSVAVLGPRKLGTLLVAALVSYRNSTGKKYKIYSIAKNPKLLELCSQIGSDFGIELPEIESGKRNEQFDIVYDTTGSSSGFETALKLSKGEVHLKSTTGKVTCGLSKLTELVVDELSILPYCAKYLDFVWSNENRKNLNIYVSPRVPKINLKDKNVFDLSASDAIKKLDSDVFANSLPRYDVGIASDLEEIDTIIRPNRMNENSLIRPRGSILFNGNSQKNPLLEFIANGGRLRTSRCGDFEKALNILKKNNKMSEKLSHFIISHLYPADELREAFEIAGKKKSVKVVIKHL
ncbi:MAG: threonine dehydrogenase [Leptospiraceae bacterium]|nr:threonine dehydrogenase [Leptospiraceae bacterium]